MDVLAILDCCFAAATRNLTDRTCQVLAACGSNETARSRSGGITFSQRLAAAARVLQRISPKPSVTIDDIYDQLQRDKPPHAPAPRLKYLCKECKYQARNSNMRLWSYQLPVSQGKQLFNLKSSFAPYPPVSRLLLSTHGNQDRSSFF